VGETCRIVTKVGSHDGSVERVNSLSAEGTMNMGSIPTKVNIFSSPSLCCPKPLWGSNWLLSTVGRESIVGGQTASDTPRHME
jgi:hypothetical protein